MRSLRYKTKCGFPLLLQPCLRKWHGSLKLFILWFPSVKTDAADECSSVFFHSVTLQVSTLLSRKVIFLGTNLPNALYRGISPTFELVPSCINLLLQGSYPIAMIQTARIYFHFRILACSCIKNIKRNRRLGASLMMELVICDITYSRWRM